MGGQAQGGSREQAEREAEGNHEAANHEKQPDSKSAVAGKDIESISSTFPFRG